MNSIIDIKFTESSPTEPCTLTEAKTHLRVDSTDDDTKITALITSCRKRLERWCGISIVQKTVVLTIDFKEEMRMIYGPVTAITEVKVRTGTDTTGAAEWETLTDDDYTTDGEDYKVFNSSLIGRHKITYTAGYSTCPEDLKEAVLNEIAYRYQNRGDQTQKYVAEQPGVCEGSKILAMPYKRTFGI
jgi:uncharacterized phiE125 gp8 family phage protein